MSGTNLTCLYKNDYAASHLANGKYLQCNPDEWSELAKWKRSIDDSFKKGGDLYAGFNDECASLRKSIEATANQKISKLRQRMSELDAKLGGKRGGRKPSGTGGGLEELARKSEDLAYIEAEQKRATVRDINDKEYEQQIKSCKEQIKEVENERDSRLSQLDVEVKCQLLEQNAQYGADVAKRYRFAAQLSDLTLPLNIENYNEEDSDGGQEFVKTSQDEPEKEKVAASFGNAVIAGIWSDDSQSNIYIGLVDVAKYQRQLAKSGQRNNKRASKAGLLYYAHTTSLDEAGQWLISLSRRIGRRAAKVSDFGELATLLDSLQNGDKNTGIAPIGGFGVGLGRLSNVNDGLTRSFDVGV